MRGGLLGEGTPTSPSMAPPAGAGIPDVTPWLPTKVGAGTKGVPLPPSTERGVPAWPGGAAGRQGRASRPLASFHTFSLSPSLFPPLHILPVELLGK